MPSLALLAFSAALATVRGQDPRFPVVQLWTCAAGAASQRWSLANASGFGRVVLASAEATTNVGWDLNGPSNATGTYLHLVQPLKSPSQQWRFDTSSGHIASLFAPRSCVTPAFAGAGAELVLGACSDPNAGFAVNAATGVITLASDPTLCVDSGSNASCATLPTSAFPFCDVDASPSVRAADLASRLTPSELASFLSNDNHGVPRLGVPRVGYGEALHGYLRPCIATPVPGSTGCPTSFPHLHLLGGSFNRSLWHATALAIADEARAYYNLINRTSHLVSWAPDINPFRDPRWGRGLEVASEDPLHLAEFIYEYARGLQEGEDERYIKLISTAKHAYGYDLENSTDASGAHYTRMNFTAVISRKDFAQFYLPPFLSATQRGRVASIMCSYQSVALDGDPHTINGTGIPSCANAALQNDMTRKQWGWNGFYVSDCDAIGEMYSAHHYTPTAYAAAVAGIRGGTDVDCGMTYTANVAQAIAKGDLTLGEVQLSAARTLTQLFALGILDPPGTHPYDAIGPERLDSPANRALALEGALQSIVLLKNDAAARNPWGATPAPLLPLQQGAKLRRIAIVGPNANATQTLLSNYEGGNTLVNSHSILQALQARASSGGFAVSYSVGCTNSTGLPNVWCQDDFGIAPAAAVARDADLAIVVVGLCSVCPDGWRVEGEGHDRTALTLPGQQDALVSAVVATGTPTVVVLIHGGPVAIEAIKASVSAIVDAHYPGELGGDAVVSILFGDVSPSGRLSGTVYPADFVAQRPMTDMALAPHDGAPGITHLYYDGPALWPFGWGLSYTTFSFAWADSGGALTAHTDSYLRAPPQYVCNVTNTGAVTSDVSVLGFFSTGIPGEPIEELFDFARIAGLAPGATVTVTLTLPAGIAATVDAAGVKSLTPGTFPVRVGEPNNYAQGTLELQGPLRALSAAEATAVTSDRVRSF